MLYGYKGLKYCQHYEGCKYGSTCPRALTDKMVSDLNTASKGKGKIPIEPCFPGCFNRFEDQPVHGSSLQGS